MAESNKQRRFFPDAFKLEAVAAIRGGRSVRGWRTSAACPTGWCEPGCSWAEAAQQQGQRAGADARQEQAAPARRVAPTRRTRRRRSGGCGVNSIASEWSATS